MSMLAIQRRQLNIFSRHEPALKPFGVLTGKTADDIRLGELMVGNGLDDVYKNPIYTIAVNVPAPAGGGAVNNYFTVFKAPADGFVTKAELFIYDDAITWTAGTTTAQNYQVALNTAFKVSASGGPGAALLTGVTNATNVELPLGIGNQVSLMTPGASYTIAASVKNIVITASTTFFNAPLVGDLLCMPANAVNFAGANKVNVGVYKVTSVTATVITATKINATNPVAVATTTAGNPEFYIGRQSIGYPIFAGDEVQVVVQVPITGGVDLSKVTFCFNLTAQFNAV